MSNSRVGLKEGVGGRQKEWFVQHCVNYFFSKPLVAESFSTDGDVVMWTSPPVASGLEYHKSITLSLVPVASQLIRLVELPG